MVRTTRSGAQWSPWALDFLDIDAVPDADVVRSRVSLAPLLRAAMEAADLRASAADLLEEPTGDEDEWEDEEPVLSRPPTPLSRTPTPLPPRGSSASPPPVSQAPPSPPSTPAPGVAAAESRPSHKARHADATKQRRRRKRVSEAKASGFGPLPKARHSQSHREDKPHATTVNAADLAESCKGGWQGGQGGQGGRPRKKARASRHVFRRLEALLEEGVDLVEWDGRRPKFIVDADGRIVAVLLGRPEGDDWDQVLTEVETLLESIRKRGEQRGVFKSKDRRHRRGKYHTIKGRVTKGPGQKRPGNLAQSKAYRELLHLILVNKAMQRIVGFQSSGLARYLPKLYEYQRQTMKGLLESQPELELPFSNSVFPTFTANLGPDVVTAQHVDMLNNPFGMCGVTSNGDYDHKLGGHIYMKQLNVVCQFPPGSTILLLSGTCEHGNTPIQKGERRYSITQYAAGALFRWAAYGFQSAESLLAKPGGAAHKLEVDGKPGERAAWALGLLSKADEVERDRREVFSRL